MATGCYTLTVNDSYGDGLQYSGVVGNYTMVDGDGNVLAQMIDGGTSGLKPWTTSAWRQATRARMH